MLLPTFPLYENRRRVRKVRAAAPPLPPPPPPPPPKALTLVAAGYDFGGMELTLTFDRPVNIDAFDRFAVYVHDGVSNRLNLYGNYATLMGAGETVKVVLTPDTPADDGLVTLSASGATGIVAADDGQAWAGVTELGLPFP